MAMRWSRWVATSAAARRPAAVDDEIVADDFVFDARRREAGGDRGEPVALLDAQFVQAVHPRRAAGEGRRDGEDRIFVDHRGRASSGNVDALEIARAHAQIRHLLAALDAPVENFDSRAHLDQRGRTSPVRSGFIITPFDDDVRARDDQGGDDGEGRRGRVGRHDDRAGPEFGRPTRVMRRPSPSASTQTSAPKWASILSVWSREASLSMTVVRPRALRPASRTADLIWAEATGVR